MKSETKKRIDQLNNGEIPKGYKKTDFGVFPCDWVTNKKLIDIGTFGKGKGIPGNKMQSDGVPCVGYGDIYMKYNHFHFEEAQSFVDEETAKDSQSIKKGTLLFTGTGETAEEIGKCVCYNGKEDIYAGGDIITFVTNQVNPLFLAYQQYQPFSLKKKASCGQGHSVVHIQKDSLEKLYVAYPPSSKEQTRIVQILMKWDKAIELYDKQIEALNRYKKVCLKKMFPAKGQTVPEWRFKGFSGDWEQYKFGELIKETRNKTTIEDEDTLLSCAIDGMFLNSELFFHFRGSSNIGYIKIKKYDLILSAQNLHLGNCNVNLRFEHGIISPAYKVFELVECNPLFIQAWVKQDSTKDFFLKSSTEGASACRKNIVWKDLFNQKVPVPNIEEQEKIGCFFNNIDNHINLHKQKCKILKRQRNALQQYLLNGIIRV